MFPPKQPVFLHIVLICLGFSICENAPGHYSYVMHAAAEHDCYMVSQRHQIDSGTRLEVRGAATLLLLVLRVRLTHRPRIQGSN